MKECCLVIVALLLLAASASAEEFAGLAPIADGHPNLPNGYSLVAHFMCDGSFENVKSDAGSITLKNGVKRKF